MPDAKSKADTDAADLAAYRKKDAEQAAAEQAVSDRGAGQHDPLPPAVAGAETDDDAA